MISCKGISKGIYSLRLYMIDNDSLYGNVFLNGLFVDYLASGSHLARNILTSCNNLKWYQTGVCGLKKSFIDSLEYGDIISINTDGTVNVLWKNNSDENILFCTDFCNSRCVMCPQSHNMKFDNYYNFALKILKLVSKEPKYICLTGGNQRLSRTNI